MKNLKKDPQRTTEIKPQISKYNSKRINFPSEKDDWKTFEKNNVTIALNGLYAKREKIYPAYFKNINVGTQFNGKQYCQKQVHFCGK